MFEWDEQKRTSNLDKHGIDFIQIYDFEWESAIITKLVYPREIRWQALGFLDSRLMVVVYTKRKNKIRIISFRKANNREVKKYVS